MALLGLEHLRQWATLTVFTSIDDKPAELTITALVRAHFCRLVAESSRDEHGNELFALGLFSVIDALLDLPMIDLVAKLPFARDVCDALVSRAGPKGLLLDCVCALEAGEFRRAEAFIPNAPALYVAALAWAEEISSWLFAETRSVPARASGQAPAGKLRMAGAPVLTR